MHRWVITAATVSAIAFTRPSRAQTMTPAEAQPTARLSLVRAEGAESCADDRAIIAEVRARLGRDAVVAQSDRAIEVYVSRERARWSATLVLREGVDRAPARRELTSSDPTCAALDAAIALAVALVIDPNGVDAATPLSNGPVTTRPDASRPDASRGSNRPISAPIAPIAPVAPTPVDAWNRSELFSLSAGLSLGATPMAAIVQLSFEGRVAASFVPLCWWGARSSRAWSTLGARR
ncbi:MAG: hypothetical protein U0269_07380 [Polyangiales bacterium]